MRNLMKKINLFLTVSLISLPLYADQPHKEEIAATARNHNADLGIGATGLALGILGFTFFLKTSNRMYQKVRIVCTNSTFHRSFEPVLSGKNDIRHLPIFIQSINELDTARNKQFFGELKEIGFKRELYLSGSSFIVSLVSAGIGSWHAAHYIADRIKEKKDKAEQNEASGQHSH
jgi:hypothetical protein